MGNTGSRPPANTDVPNRPHLPSRTSSTAPHRSLRTKRKSLELPDLASLALSSTTSSSSRQPPHSSSPIPIPGSPANGQVQRSRPVDLPSTQHLSTDLLLEPSTHIPINHHTRGFPHGVPYSSTRSFSQVRLQEDFAPPAFVQETVRSTIPVALHTHRDHEPTQKDEQSRSRSSTIDEHVDVKVSWHGGGKKVQLAPSEEDEWTSRLDMHQEDDVWSVHLKLPPGTHHIKFVVDGQLRVAEDLPAAVDDDGSLANYITVPAPVRVQPSQLAPSAPANSFWSASSSSSHPAPQGSGDWTNIVPGELAAAAKEEEIYLSASSALPAPNIPPAPALPRHLEKLILNVRPTQQTRVDRKGTRSKSKLAMTSTSEDQGKAPDDSIPVTTASGTDVTGKIMESKLGLDAMAMADDTSVLPVPSHVVLHHLSTSAIRNGVLAVGSTTRYKKKYLTTIYYKPT